MALSLTYICMSYNYGCYMAENRAGLAIQARQPDRVIVTDDCSPKDDFEDIRRIWRDVPQAEFIQNERNMGSIPHTQRNISLVDSDAYISTSADDYLIDPDFLKDAIDVLERYPNVVAVEGLFRAVGDDGNPLFYQRSPGMNADAPMTIVPGSILRKRMAFENVVSAVSTVVRTSAHAKTAAYPVANEGMGDWIHWYLLTLAGDFARLNRPVIHYRVHGGNLHLTNDHVPDGNRKLQRQAYDTLLGWPGLSDEDRHWLRVGRAQTEIRAARAKELPRAMWENGRTPMAARALAWSLCCRAERRLPWLQGLTSKLRAWSVDDVAPLP